MACVEVRLARETRQALFSPLDITPSQLESPLLPLEPTPRVTTPSTLPIEDPFKFLVVTPRRASCIYSGYASTTEYVVDYLMHYRLIEYASLVNQI